MSEENGFAVSDLTYSLTLLGLPVVRRIAPDGRVLELSWRLKRALQVLAYLALAPDRRCHKDELVEAIWPDASVETTTKNFHPTLSDVRRTLAGPRVGPGGRRREEVLVYRHGIYALASDVDWSVDVERFRQRIAEGIELRRTAPERALAAWTAAWKLHRGPFLAGSEAPWIARRREELHRDYLSVLIGIGQLSAELERLTEALDAYRAVLIEEPYEEHVHMAVMELYARQGRRDLVRRQFVRLQELVKELDVEPLEEVQSCYHRLMR